MVADALRVFRVGPREALAFQTIISSASRLSVLLGRFTESGIGMALDKLPREPEPLSTYEAKVKGGVPKASSQGSPDAPTHAVMISSMCKGNGSETTAAVPRSL